MRGPTVAAVAVVAALVAFVSAQVAGAAATGRGGGVGPGAADMGDAAMSGFIGSQEVQYPSRPNMFKSPVELRQYLNALDAYYAIAGRPRFGKRGMRGASQQRPAFSPDLYDY